MLFGQYFGGRHDARLVAVVEGYEHGHERHEGLAGAHVALQQSVHLPAGAEVYSDFAHHALLGVGEGEGQVVLVEGVEYVAHVGKHVAPVFAAVVAGVAQYV